MSTFDLNPGQMDSIRYELLKTRLEIYEETFRNIYSEIHDNVGQQLSVCRLYLSSVEERLTKPDNEKVGDVRFWLGQSIRYHFGAEGVP